MLKTKALIVLGIVCLQYAHAASTGDVTVHLEVFKVSAVADGKEILKPADAALPGDTLEYRVVYHNQGKSTARNVEATLPIPDSNVAYIVDSAQPRNPLASTDGARFEAMPLKRSVTRPDGTPQIQTVPLSEYRALRWKLGDLPAGARATVTSRVRVGSLAESGNAPTNSGRRAGSNVASR